ncbi:MAG TPA: molybdopterin molybdenumtransferase MoeA [Gammaproteobacteria bacterium]|nr:molybdopterin molybdenumtransferase MoeA [Gammaproteobacteria bacterium]
MMNDSTPLTEAQRSYADALPLRATGAETVTLLEALGRTVYQDLIAPGDVPPYHRAIVEGYLVRTEDTRSASEQAPVSFTVVGAVHPGDESCLEPATGLAMEVTTGSLVPGGPYSIVRQWEAEREGANITITRPFPPRFFIEDQGCEIAQGSVVLAAGTVVGPREIGALADLGLTALSVALPPKVAIFACGDEVIPHNQPLKPGLIRDSNSPMLAAAVTQAGGEAVLKGIMADDFDGFLAAARQALKEADILLIAGGTAAGGRDFVSDLFRELGTVVVDGVPMRSGRPLIMGAAGGKPLVGVAGHPPEALRGFRLFGALAINRLLGRDVPLPEDPRQT